MMGRLQLLTVLALLALCAASGAGATGLRAWLKLGGGDEPSPSANCLDYQSEDGCLEQATCSWCTNAVLGTEGCVPQKVASLVPAALAECTDASNPDDDDDDDDDDDERLRAGKHSHDDDDDDKPKPPTSCGDNKEKHDCLHLGAEEGDCAWCAGDFMPASCVGVKAAEWIPEQVAKCRMPKKKHDKDGELTKGKHSHDDDDDDDDKPKPKPPTSCGDNKEKHDCLHLGAEEGDCAWCAGDFMPASCVGIKAAEWIPEQVAKCRMPKKHRDDDDDAAVAVLSRKHKHKRHDDDDDDSGSGGGGFIPGGGGWPGSSGGYPGSSGGYPGSSGGGSAGGGGQGCMALKTKKKCLKGTDTEACAWCGSASFLGSPCVSESTAKYLPKMVADCKMGKGPKKGADAAVATS